ncbi:MAG: lipopolysaccharide biosynthesis protein [Bacteroidales bacterium]|nr:lipopolysaccharide biosynthesis protein [Bacteroidales bacterium]
MGEKDMQMIAGTRRVARNTLLLYVRMFLLMLIGLYTSRVVLQALGETDFGVYTEVGGFVAMFSLLSGPLSSAISRFLTFELGKGAEGRPGTVFSSAVLIQLCLVALVVVATECIGPWYISHHLNIPEERLQAARWIFQFSLAAFAVNLLSVPYNASIIAHEKMEAFALIGIFEGAAKLAVAFLLAAAPVDTLVWYGALMAGVALAVRLCYGLYCRRHFDECRLRRTCERRAVREMFSFAGWNFIGSGSAVLRDYGGTLLLGYFFPPALAAARGLATQVNGVVYQFVSSFTTALNPQITKSYAAGEHAYMTGLVLRGSRFSFFLLAAVCIPVLLNTPWLMDIWQVTVPAHTVRFVQLVLVFTMVESLSYPLVTAMLSTGKIRDYQLLVGGLQLLNLPLAWWLLRATRVPESVYVVSIALALVCLAARVGMLRKMIAFPVRRFGSEVLVRIAAVLLVSLPVPTLLALRMPDGFARLAVTTAVFLLFLAAGLWLAGLRPDEKALVRSEIRKRMGREAS